jgi:hypothetical protein
MSNCILERTTELQDTNLKVRDEQLRKLIHHPPETTGAVAALIMTGYQATNEYY